MDPKLEYLVAPGIDEETPGIYEIKIDGIGSYIGRFGRARERYLAYERNVRRLESGEPYKGGITDFRKIHYIIRDALREARTVSFIALENRPASLATDRRADLIRERGNLNTA